ncbi:hypothetical protein VZT92_026793 [Zoarces viviparus]|uniref:Uncharacterized protein n=1 Tax=Zoarces viviparus TaxID=48416 RepID=A0AAW1DRB1_ZOAVI
MERRRKSDGREQETDRVERPRKCLQGASQEEVPVAVTTAEALVAMGTSRAGKNSPVNKAKPTLSFLFFLMRRNYP